MKNFGIIFLVFSFILSASWLNIILGSAECVRPTKASELRVNNVRARLATGGDLFYESQYITPITKVGQIPVSGIYSAGVWAGGVSKTRNTKLSAITYRNVGFDFFAGPLDLNGSTEKQLCDQWDKIFTVKGANIQKHIKLFNIAIQNNRPYDCNEIDEDVLYWPAQGNINFEEKYGWKLPDQPLAGYFDMDNDGKYDPCKGDYPMIENDNLCSYYHEGLLIPSEIQYFVFNDAGGQQTLTGPSSIQMEFHVNAYAYATNNELNDMTFYQYKTINKSNEVLYDFHFSFWVDPDLGCYNDDYIGYDPERNMAYVYNGDSIDGDNISRTCSGTNTYGDNIPVIGFDLTETPLIPKIFKRDNNGGILLDESGNKVLATPLPYTETYDTLVREQLKSFSYLENAGIGNFPPATTAPQRGRDDGFFNCIRGFWSDGTPLTKAGTGYNPGSTDSVQYAFPDYPSDPNGWSMCSANQLLGDRQFLMSAGPGILIPGQVNNFTMSIFTVFDIKHPCPDMSKLVYTNDLVQEFFDNCFNELSVQAPDCPEIKVLDNANRLELSLFNEEYSNNYMESFTTKVPKVIGNVDSFYRFEGYRLYQLRNKIVTYNQLNDIVLAKEIDQSDIKNGISEILNWQMILNPSQSGDTYIWTPLSVVKGSDQGLKTSFIVEKDAFSNGAPLINDKEYHFAAVAYAHNNWKGFDYVTKTGQKTPYISGSSNFKVFSFKPKITSNINDGNEKNNKVSIFPNPANSNAGNLNITITDLPKKGTLSIYDSFGNFIEHKNTSDGTSSFVGPKGVAHTFELKSNGYKSGMYLVQIKDSDTGKVSTAKWVVL